MAIPKITGAQRDFSSGELDVSMKRADESPAMKSGARQLLNYRILNSKAVQNRPGRSALFFEIGRVEEVLMSPGNIFYIAFGIGYIRIFNAAGTVVFFSAVKGDGATAVPWTSLNTLGSITWANVGLAIYIFYGQAAPNNVPQILTWDGISQTSTWTLTTYAEALTAGSQKRTLFYRISPQNITLLPGGVTGPISIQFSAPVLLSGMVGTRMAYCGREFTITGITDSENGTANVNEVLPAGEILPFTPSDPTTTFSVGDIVVGAVSGAKGIVTVVSGTPTDTISVQLIPPNLGFVPNETIVGPGGSLKMTGGASSTSPFAVSFWVDEVMNTFRGYPASVNVDQGRLVLSNFPSVPSGVAWSTIGIPTDFYVVPDVAVASPDSAIFEIAPGKSQVLYVIPGMESSEFVFCDNAIYFIPISVQSPLVPGSVQFTELSGAGIFPGVQPRRTEQTIVYMKSGGIQVAAVQVPGAYNRPYIVDNISDFHSHLFKGKAPIAIAIPTATGQFEESYIYIAFSDGSLAIGKYAMKSGLLEATSDNRPNVGWVPWNGAGTVLWASAFGASVIFCTLYSIAGSTPQSIVEQLDDAQYLDQAVFVNNVPVPLQRAGLGPLWFIAGGSVTLMDQGTRMMGTYQVDATGHIVPQNNGGENLAAATLVAGQPWTAVMEPFVPDAQPGNSAHQRMFKRRVSRLAVYVSNSTGFLMARLFAGPITRTSPPLGTIMNTYRIPAWNQDDDATKPPPLREEADRWRPLGRAYDPRVAVIKDTPGPLLIHEVGIEASI